MIVAPAGPATRQGVIFFEFNMHEKTIQRIGSYVE